MTATPYRPAKDSRVHVKTGPYRGHTGTVVDAGWHIEGMGATHALVQLDGHADPAVLMFAEIQPIEGG